MSIVIAKGAVKFKSLRAMARSLSTKTGEPEDRVYIRMYMRLRKGKPASKAYHEKPRKYVRRITTDSFEQHMPA